MDEPVKMKKRVDQGKLNIIAIFYKVCARDVKKQTCEFGENFWKLTRASSGDQVKMWKECVSNKICLSKTRDARSQTDVAQKKKIILGQGQSSFKKKLQLKSEAVI
ncbi:unnamed protein product [Brassica oleracea]